LASLLYLPKKKTIRGKQRTCLALLGESSKLFSRTFGFSSRLWGGEGEKEFRVIIMFPRPFLPQNE
jgi:hypothetical protein